VGRRQESSLELAVGSVGRSVLGWVGFIGGGCGEDSLDVHIVVYEFSPIF
jgi:hypothetical protein